jgi:hypothetical protein
LIGRLHRRRVNIRLPSLMEWSAPLADGVRLTGPSKGRVRAMQITVLGIDLGKNSCSIVGLDAAGAVVIVDLEFPPGSLYRRTCCEERSIRRRSR